MTQSNASNIIAMEKSIRKAWSAHTSSDAQHWSRNNPSLGQCAVTSCYVQDKMGGDLVRVAYTAPDGTQGSHYFNVLGDGQRVDLTKDQFSNGTIFTPPLDASNTTLIETTKEYIKSKAFDGSARDYVLSYPPTLERYERLKANISQANTKER